MGPVDPVRLGTTGLKISRVGLGCGGFGGVGSAPELFGKGESELEAFALMDAAWDMGIHFFDTANSYGGGRSEAMIGRWLKTKGADVRARILVSTKVFNPVGEGPNDRGLSRRHIRREIENSLTRLGIDRVDMYLVHDPDPETPLEETLGVLDDLVHEGKVHYVGASNLEPWRLARALGLSARLGLVRFEWAQVSYNLLDRGVERDLFPLAAEERIGVTPFSPLAGGWLTGKYSRGAGFPAGSRMTLRPGPYEHLVHEKTFQSLDALGAEARARGVSMGALALAWVLSHPQVAAIIVGPRCLEHLDPVREALGFRLTELERARIAGFFSS